MNYRSLTIQIELAKIGDDLGGAVGEITLLHKDDPKENVTREVMLPIPSVQAATDDVWPIAISYAALCTQTFLAVEKFKRES